MARRTKLTKETTEAVCTAVSIGMSYEKAAIWGGISEGTFYGWMRKGRAELTRRENGEKADKAKSKYVKFLQEIEEASVDALARWQNVINQAATVEPTWARWMLELRDPKGYGKGQGGGAVTYNVDVTQLSDEQLSRLIKGEDPSIVFSTSLDGGSGNETPPESAGDDTPG